MATVSYKLVDIAGTKTIDLANPGNTFAPNIVAGADGNVLMTFDSSAGADVKGAILAPDGSRLGSLFNINTTQTGGQFDSHSALLKDGNFVTVYTDNGADGTTVHIKLTGSAGAGIKPDFPIAESPLPQFEPRVAALSDGGFVVTWTKQFGGGDFDTKAQMYNANGSLRGPEIVVDQSSSLATTDSSVVGLANGGFVASWTERPIAGGSLNVIMQVYDAAGNKVGGQLFFDDVGTINTNVQMVGLPDGGFAVAYEDNNGVGSDRDITMQIFNANGTARTDFFRVNDGATAGNQTQPTLTVLSNGTIAVGWTTVSSSFDKDINAVVYDAQGHQLTAITAIAQNSADETELSLAGLKNGVLGTAFTSDQGPASPSQVQYHEFALERTTTGNDTAEILKGDDLIDTIFGKGGNDQLFGFDGKDALFGDAGNDTLDGGTGADTMKGGAGNDIYVVDNLADSVAELAGEGTDTVKSSISLALGGNVENLTLTGKAAINGVGNGLANTIIGNTAANSLTGNTGADKLTGGLGADTFVFKTVVDSTVAATGRDVINDFSQLQKDHIDLHLIDAVAGSVGNQQFSFIGTGAFGHHAGELHFAFAGTNTIVSGDVDGDAKADFSILLAGHVNLTAGDFLL